MTVVQDVIDAAAMGVNAIGLNFSRHSARQVDLPLAIKLVSAFRGQGAGLNTSAPQQTSRMVVGVFVEHTVEQANEVADEVGLDMIQLHGDHSPRCLAAANRPVIWVLRVKSTTSEELVQHICGRLLEIQDCKNENPAVGENLAGVLLDAHVEGEWGGTGQALAWQPLGQRFQWENNRQTIEPTGIQQLGSGQTNAAVHNWPTGLPLILAGGITPENVAKAIAQAQPDAIDIASGVEDSPGKKNLSKIAHVLNVAQIDSPPNH